jgi:hypothetical protein
LCWLGWFGPNQNGRGRQPQQAWQFKADEDQLRMSMGIGIGIGIGEFSSLNYLRILQPATNPFPNSLGLSHNWPRRLLLSL